ncbi:hypothetical protein Tco_1273033 [Tanacetum coccineum]
MKELNDTNFDEMPYEHLKEIAKRLVPHACFEKIYYFQTGAKLSLGVRELKSTQDIADMLKVGYDNGNEIDIYVEQFGYDIIELAELERNEEQNHNSIESSHDEYYSSDDCEEIENVDFQIEGDESVVIKNISTQDPFLNKLCSARIMFRGNVEHHETETPLVNPDENQIDSVNKVQSGVLYPDEANASKRKRRRPPSHVDGIRIYHKNRGRSQRIANMKKLFQFDKHGTGSTLEKAFNVDD